jgi:hypothetical protein
MEAINSSAGVVVPGHSGFMSIKLDRTNYPLWLAQIVPILKSKNLMGLSQVQILARQNSNQILTAP